MANDKKEQKKPEEYWRRRALRIDEILESWRTVASFTMMALKSSILLNGAASIAILAFISSLFGDEPSKNILPNLVDVLRHFLIGTFAAVIATTSAYFSAYSENRGLWLWVKGNSHSGKMDYITMFFHIVAVVLVGYSYWRFWLGMSLGTTALTS